MRMNTVMVLRKETAAAGSAVRLPVRRRPSAPAGPGAAAPTGVAQEARVIEANDQYAVIEVTCGCGRTMRLQCRYGSE